MSDPYSPPVTPVSDTPSTSEPRRAILLWLTTLFWLLTGALQIIQLVPAIPILHEQHYMVMAYAALAALIGVLSISGAWMLMRRGRAAIVLLLLAFVLGSIPLGIAAFWRPILSLDWVVLVTWALGAASCLYVWLLAKRRFLK
jgi:hypothetical protein